MTTAKSIMGGSLSGKPFVSCIAQPGDWAWQAYHAFDGGDSTLSDSTNGDAQPEYTAPKSPMQIVLDRIAELKPAENFRPCHCGCEVRWRDCYSTTNLHCERCRKPPSLAMVKNVFVVLVFKKGEHAGKYGLLDATEVMKPLMQREEFEKRNLKRKAS